KPSALGRAAGMALICSVKKYLNPNTSGTPGGEQGGAFRPAAGAHAGGRTAPTPAAPAEVALIVPMRCAAPEVALIVPMRTKGTGELRRSTHGGPLEGPDQRVVGVLGVLGVGAPEVEAAGVAERAHGQMDPGRAARAHTPPAPPPRSPSVPPPGGCEAAGRAPFRSLPSPAP